MAKVTVNFQSDDKDVIAAIDKVNRKLAEMDQKAAAAAQKGKGGMDAMIASAGSVVAGYMSIQYAIQLVNDELQRKIELEEKSKQRQLAAAGPERELMLNLGYPLAPAERDRALQRARDIADRVGISESMVAGATSRALSNAAGNQDVAFNAVEIAARTAPHSAEVMERIAGAITSIGKATGKFDNERGYDMLVLLGQLTNAPGWDKIGGNAPQSLAGMIVNGATLEEAVSVQAALSNTMTDEELLKSGTAGQQLAAKLRDVFPEKDSYETNAKGKKTLKARGTGMTTFAERYAHVLKDDKAREFFRSKLEEGNNKAFLEEFITPGSRGSQLFSDFLKQAEGLPRGAMAGLPDALNSTPLQQQANLERRLERIDEKADIEDVKGGQRAIIRDKLQKALVRSGQWTVPTMADMWSYDMAEWVGQTPEQAAIEALQRRAAPNIKRQPGQKITDEMYEAVPNLGPLIKELRGIQRNQRAGNARQHVEGR